MIVRSRIRLYRQRTFSSEGEMVEDVVITLLLFSISLWDETSREMDIFVSENVLSVVNLSTGVCEICHSVDCYYFAQFQVIC